ncbi:TonB-dependent receptor [Flavihumibacter solisilvae]|uniref:TonB-dependent receptor n=1 Tax=Flavihumibacter solisilvae TaxID=1349421 RepID=A0A0C1L8G4_9BACT|nr:TonB-dependent receptor [Flavihumibacter solisilvae]KIC96437.1 TonB-dependent receptor [Flavihumibacter solisilvae]
MKNLAFTTLLVVACVSVMAQATTSSISGQITDSKGQPLINATVTVTHTPTGTAHSTTTKTDGRFTVPNLRVGGPYTINLSHVGHQPKTIENVTLSLGQPYAVDEALTESSTDLSSVVVVGQRNPVMSARRTGLSTQVTSEQLRNLPTISRSAMDYTRLTPASDGFSFAGRNSQYNNFSLDGAVFNNPFGLDAATPGGQTDAQPISLDAIEQIQVAIAPYDITQAGFTGASVNTVTKSGTNQFRGTAYAFYRNEDLTGKKVKGNKILAPDLNQFQGGFAFGGPIIKNKLFFFVNAELEDRTDQGSNFVAARPGLSGSNVSRVTAEDLESVSTALRNRFQYETGVYEGYTHNTDNVKGLVKLDWNISSKHSLAFTYNFLDASKDKPAHPSAIGRRGPDYTTLQFYNSGYTINNKLNNFALELKSNISSTYANKFRAVYTTFRDTRDPFSVPFPVININKDGVRYIVAGHEPFSIHNKLNQDAFQVTDNFNIFLNKHTLTLGGSFEQFKFENSFNLDAYGGTFGPGHASVQEFVNQVNSGDFDDEVAFARNAFEAGNWNWANSKLGQFALYAQDEWSILKNLRVTVGVRMDIPLYFDTKDNIIPNKDDVTYYDENGTPVKLDNTKLPDQTPLFSPRLGFNWDVFGNKTLQVRGGTGLFTGRFPFVWVGNQVANPYWFYYNVTAPDFEWPQVWRSNIGVDYRFASGWTTSLDVVYTKDLNAMMVRNYGLNLPTSTLNGVEDRLVYDNANKAHYDGLGFPIPVSAYVFDNVKVGHQFNISAQVQRYFEKGYYVMFGYNYLTAEDASSISAEISGDAFDRNPAINNVNDAISTPSLYGNKHRFVAAGFRKFTYSKDKLATTVSLFAQYAQGGRFTYTYAGDINNDGSVFNDLIYIPTDADLDVMTFSGNAQAQASQREGYRAFIEQDDYLSGRRGQYAEKYAILSPWYSNWDFRLLQDFNFKVGERINTVQFSMDVLNIGNLINSDWGVRQLPINSQPVGVSVVNNTPIYSFDTAQQTTFVDDFSLLSRWQIQFGLRYIF